ncbi:MAG: flagellar export chaperone FliS [Acidobacteriaceae bacterium]|nr:flagellar export chaperone FliS [Acidobacteriaceae bacterium]
MSDARSFYREAAVRGASPVQLVILLYEQVVEDLRRAVRAIDEHRIEERTRAINHAILIVGHLQNKLNHEAGGEVARNLERFYEVNRQKLLEAQARVSKEVIVELIDLWLGLRNVWSVVERKEGAPAAPPTNSVVPETSTQDEQNRHADWKG